MSHDVIGLAALLLALGFGWMCARDVKRGVATFPRPYVELDRGVQPKLFWATVGVNFAVTCGLLYADWKLLTQ